MSTEARISEESRGLGFFERYLTVWVALCIVAGIGLGKVAPGVALWLDGIALKVGALKLSRRDVVDRIVDAPIQDEDVGAIDERHVELAEGLAPLEPLVLQAELEAMARTNEKFAKKKPKSLSTKKTGSSLVRELK